MGRRHDVELQAGEDSFLDTIANLVGIIIILVVIVGARSYSSAKVLADQKIEEEMTAAKPSLERSVRIGEDLGMHIEESNRFEREIAVKSNERMFRLDQSNAMKKIIEEELKELSQSDQSDVQSTAELNELERQLAELLKMQGELSLAESPPAILQHLPTPMAKTVFGQEVHVMMVKGFVVVIPWNELVESLKREVRGVAERNAQRTSISNTLGPIGGFTMKYALKNQSGVMTDGTSARIGRMIELDRFVLIPGEDILLQTIDEALMPGGRLRAELAANRNNNVTITVWVYPDSFKEFRELKDRLFPEGFLCAARPLPFGVPIGASPSGTASTAQ